MFELNANRDWIDVALAAVQAASLIALIIYVWKTWQMAAATRLAAEASAESLRLAEKAREEESAPYIVVYFDMPFGSSLVYLVMKNVGKTVAENVRIQFDPPLPEVAGYGDIGKLPMKADSMGTFPPGYEMKTILSDSAHYLHNSMLPPFFRVCSKYEHGITHAPRETNQIVDLELFRFRAYTSEIGTKDIVEQLENLVKATDTSADYLHDIAENLSTNLWIHSASDVHRTNSNTRWKADAKQQLIILRMLWADSYLSEPVKYKLQINSLTSRSLELRTKLMTLAALQLVTIPVETRNSISKIAEKLYQLQKPELRDVSSNYTPQLDAFARELVELIDESMILIEAIPLRVRRPLQRVTKNSSAR